MDSYSNELVDAPVGSRREMDRKQMDFDVIVKSYGKDVSIELDRAPMPSISTNYKLDSVGTKYDLYNMSSNKKYLIVGKSYKNSEITNYELEINMNNYSFKYKRDWEIATGNIIDEISGNCRPS